MPGHGRRRRFRRRGSRKSARRRDSEHEEKEHPAFRRGQIVAVEFLDHCQDGDGKPLCFVVFGRLVAVDRQSLTVACWTYSDLHRERMGDANVTSFTIVRSAIQNVTRLQREDVSRKGAKAQRKGT